LGNLKRAQLMKDLGPYRKYIIAAAIVQSVIVICASYLLFKSKSDNLSPQDNVQEPPAVEAPATNS
jgi:hypothetical protein